MSDVKLCRICLQTETNLYRLDQFQLRCYYEEVMALKVSKWDDLPQYSCGECAVWLDKFYKFKRKCHISLQTLREIQWKGPITYEVINSLDRENLIASTSDNEDIEKETEVFSNDIIIKKEIEIDPFDAINKQTNADNIDNEESLIKLQPDDDVDSIGEETQNIEPQCSSDNEPCKLELDADARQKSDVVKRRRKTIPRYMKKIKKERDESMGTQKKVRQKYKYSKDNLVKALEEIRNKTMGIREACRHYGVPKTTVHDRLSGKVADTTKFKTGPDPVLGKECEEQLKNWLVDMARCGLSLKKKDLIDEATKIIQESGLKNSFKNGTPGQTWYHLFLKRHPELTGIRKQVKKKKAKQKLDVDVKTSD